MRNHTFSPLGSGVKLAMCILFFLSFFTKNYAQTLTCSMNKVFQMPTTSCALTLTSADILVGNGNGAGPFTLNLRTPSGATIANNMLSAQHLGQNIMATVTNTSNNNSCMVTLTVADSVPPKLTCISGVLECNVSTAPANIGLVTVEEFCSPATTTLTLVSDISMPQPCTSPYSSIIVRQFRALDASGNSSTCNQTLSVRRPLATDVVAPKDTSLACGVTANTSVTGVPLLDGNPLASTCSMGAGITRQDTVFNCGTSAYTITREWTVMENTCANNMAMVRQRITVLDTVPPVLTCVPSFTYSTKLDSCFANITTLPLATLVAGGCSSSKIHLKWAFGTDSLGTYKRVPKGVYPITYTIETCGGRDTCHSQIIVKDDQLPTPVCKGARTLSLTSSAQVMRYAAWFDDGSTDNCDNVVFSARRDNAPFSDRVTFDCADVNKTVMVTLRVREANDTTAYADCMTSVTIQDKLGPVLNCPANVTVDCLYDYLNPGLMGSPTAADACGIDTIEMNQVENVNACGIGIVTRTYSASDVNGNESTCTQTISVVNGQPFNGSTIKWPLNYMTYAPAHDLRPDSLPAGSDWPKWTNPGCSMIGVSYQDELLNVAFPACYKIMRRWTVVDWCQKNPADTTQSMRWQYFQTIQVLDPAAPVLTVPANVTVSPGAGCSNPFVQLPAATATDISPDLKITNNSPYADVAGANASGYYPIGVHKVTFRATDGCGNISVGTTTITIRDVKAPTPLCRNGLTGNMTQMSTGYMLEVYASAFNAGSTDNCTAAANLDVKIRRKGATTPPTSILAFDCDSKGFQQVEMHVTDALGNSSYCETYIIVQDNMGMCPPDSTNLLRVAGCVLTEAGKKVQGVSVSLANLANVFPVTTDFAGNFLLENLPMNGNYTLDPYSNEAPLNGVNSYDLLRIQKHLLGLDPLTTPYSLLAADVNHSNSITPSDILDLRKLILGMYDEFPNNDSWRFVEGSFNFPVPGNPWFTSFPEVKKLNQLHNSLTNADFKGIKVGDVNGDAKTNADANDDRSGMHKLIVQLPAKALTAGQEYVLPVSGKNQAALEGLQLTLGFDAKKVEFLNWSAGILDKMEANTAYHREGRLAFLWTNPEGFTMPADDALFYVKIKAKSDINSQDAFFVDVAPTPALAFLENAEPKTVQLEFLNEKLEVVSSENQLLVNQPNPFRSHTMVRVQLAKASKTRLEIFDATGRLVYSTSQLLEAGLNQWVLQATDIPSSGVYAYRVSAGDWSETGRMVKE